jgi:hypothetical protein
VRSHFITLFSAGAQRFLPATGNVRNYAEPKPFSGAKLAQVGFSPSHFTVQDHIPIPSTAGDVLRHPPNTLAYFSKVVSCYQCNNTPKTDLTSVMVPMGSTQNYAKFCPIIFPEIKAKHEHEHIFVASKVKQTCKRD